MTNALFGFRNHALTGAFTASASVAGLGPDQLAGPHGATSASWQTPAGTTSGWVRLDAGAAVEWGAFSLCNTNLTSAATVRWRLSDDATFAASPVWDSGALPAVAAGYRQAVAVEPAALQTAVTPNVVRNPRAAGSLAGVVGSGGAMPTHWARSVSAGVTVEVIGVVTLAGLPGLRVRVSGTAGAGGFCALDFDTTTGIVAAPGQNWVGSASWQLVAGSTANVANSRLQVFGRTAGGAEIAGNQFSLVTFPSASAARPVLAAPLTSDATIARINHRIGFNFNAGAIDMTLDLALPQLERGATATAPLLPPALARYMRVDIADPGNPATFLRAAQLYAGPVARPARNIGYETAFARTVDAPALTTRGGQEFPILRHTRRSWRIALPTLAEDEVWPLVDALQLAAADGRNVLFLPFPGGPNLQREAVFGRLTDPAPITWPNPTPIRRAWSATITERL